MISTCTPAFFHRVRHLGHDTQQPIFIVGLPGSGTTLIEQILAGHSQMFGAGELRLGLEDFQSLAGDAGDEAAAFEALGHLDLQTARLVRRSSTWTASTNWPPRRCAWPTWKGWCGGW